MNEKHRSELSWTLEDYEERGLEPPPIVIDNPETAEGLLMSDEEVDAYIRDAVATLRIMQDQESPKFEALHSAFLADLEFFVLIGKMHSDDYAEIIKPETFGF